MAGKPQGGLALLLSPLEGNDLLLTRLYMEWHNVPKCCVKEGELFLKITGIGKQGKEGA